MQLLLESLICWFPFIIRLYYGFSSSIGSNYFLNGHIMTLNVPAKKIWVDASSKMELRMTITGKDIGFRSEGNARYLSERIDSASLSSLTFWRNGQEEVVDAVMTSAPYSKGFSLLLMQRLQCCPSLKFLDLNQWYGQIKSLLKLNSS